MPFWTVEDAGPYKIKSNFLMRTILFCRFFPAMRAVCFINVHKFFIESLFLCVIMQI